MRKLVKNIKGGDIILLHDKDEKCLEITAQLLTWLQKNNYTVLGLEKLLNIKAYAEN